MSDFDTRPRGTIIYGGFRDTVGAERALRVLKNAGYMRADVSASPQEFPASAIVVTVDAAATGAARAAEILEEYGAELRYAAQTQGGATPVAEARLGEHAFESLPPGSHVVSPQPTNATVPDAPAGGPLVRISGAQQRERKPRLRKNGKPKAVVPQDVVIRTRGIDVMPLGESFSTAEPLAEET